MLFKKIREITYRLEGDIVDGEDVKVLHAVHDVRVGVAPLVLQAHGLEEVLHGVEGEDAELGGGAGVLVDDEAALVLVDALLVGAVVLLVQLRGGKTFFIIIKKEKKVAVFQIRICTVLDQYSMLFWIRLQNSIEYSDLITN